jgi:hypothetical protein
MYSATGSYLYQFSPSAKTASESYAGPRPSYFSLLLPPNPSQLYAKTIQITVHKDLQAYKIQQCEQFLQTILQRGTIPVMNSRK